MPSKPCSRTASISSCFAIGRELMHGLRSRIDALRGLAGILRPTIHQAPCRRDRFAAFIGGFEDEVGLRGSNIKARRIVAELAFRNASMVASSVLSRHVMVNR